MALRMVQLICILCCWKVVADAGRMMMMGLLARDHCDHCVLVGH
jgi:hypothetical protein